MLRCDKKHLTAGLQLILYTNVLIWNLQMKMKVEEWALNDCRDETKLESHDSVQTTDLAII